MWILRGLGDRWRIEVDGEFALIPSADASQASAFLDREPGDFRLVLSNPDRRSGQHGQVSVELE